MNKNKYNMTQIEYIYYRPEWTCGRYEKVTDSALLYNLIEGMSYFFVDASAKVVGVMLKYKRNIPISLSEISQACTLPIDILKGFCDNLKNLGLLTDSLPSRESIIAYRKAARTKHLQESCIQVDTLKEKNQLSHSNVEIAYMERTGKIASVMFELTYNCSERCLHCYNPGATRNEDEQSFRGKREELGLQDYYTLIDTLIEQGLSRVVLSGGDPFSKAHVWDIMEYLYEKEVAFDLFTNGINVIDDVNRLASLYPRHVGVSLYSADPVTHDTITRRKGSCEITKTFIERCSEFGIPLHIKCCIMRPNVSNYYTVREFALKVGAIPQFDLNITDSVDGDTCASKYLSLTSEMMEVVLTDEDLPYYINGSGLLVKEPDSDEQLCTAGKGNFAITPEGNVQPCCAFPMYLGNVKENNIIDIVNNSKPLKEWQLMKAGDLHDCFKHPYCVYCQMCVGNNYIAHGTTLKASQNNCRLALERYNLAKKMAEGYNPLYGKTLKERLAEFKYSPIRLERQYSKNYRDNRG